MGFRIASSGRSRVRPFALALVATVIGGALSSCDTFGTRGEGDLDEARERWRDANVGAYVYTLQRSCFCAPESIGPVEISVVDGRVVQRVHTSPELTVQGGDDRWPAIEGLFDYVDRALREADEITVRYHPDLGYPVEVSVDWIREAVDDEESLTIQSFTRQAS